MKHCHECNRHLPVSSFSRKAKAPDGLQHTCKQCSNVYRNAWQKARRMGKKYRTTRDEIECTYTEPDIRTFYALLISGFRASADPVFVPKHCLTEAFTITYDKVITRLEKHWEHFNKVPETVK